MTPHYLLRGAQGVNAISTAGGKALATAGEDGRSMDLVVRHADARLASSKLGGWIQKLLAGNSTRAGTLRLSSEPLQHPPSRALIDSAVEDTLYAALCATHNWTLVRFGGTRWLVRGQATDETIIDSTTTKRSFDADCLSFKFRSTDTNCAVLIMRGFATVDVCKVDMLDACPRVCRHQLATAGSVDLDLVVHILHILHMRINIQMCIQMIFQEQTDFVCKSKHVLGYPLANGYFVRRIR